jgi:hypothetical protein
MKPSYLFAYLFIYDLYNDIVSISVEYRITGRLMNSELERAWKEAAMA